MRHALNKALHAHSSPPRHQLMQAIWNGARRRQNPCIAKGRTIVIGTSQGLYARAHALEENVLEIRTTTECGQVYGPKRLPLDPQLLTEVRSVDLEVLLELWRRVRRTTPAHFA